jgi:hypothetical protein
MDLTIGSFNFCVGSLGSLRLSDPILSGLSAGKSAAAKILETSVSSSSKVNSPASGKPAKSKRNIVNELDKIMENLNLKESLDYSDMESEGNSFSISNYSEEDFTACYGDVSYSSEDEWMSGLALHDDKQTIFSLGANHNIRNQHQMYAIINDTSEELDNDNNPIINPQNTQQGANHMAEGDIEATVAARVKFILQQQSGRQLKRSLVTT